MKGTAGDYPTRREATRQQPFHLLPQSFIRARRGGHVPFHTAGTIREKAMAVWPQFYDKIGDISLLDTMMKSLGRTRPQ